MGVAVIVLGKLFVANLHHDVTAKNLPIGNNGYSMST